MNTGSPIRIRPSEWPSKPQSSVYGFMACSKPQIKMDHESVKFGLNSRLSTDHFMITAVLFPSSFSYQCCIDKVPYRIVVNSV